MTIRGVPECCALLVLSLSCPVVFGQIDQRDCDSSLPGVVNGTFDCPLEDGGLDPGWKVEGASGDVIGYRAEIREHPQRRSNVLWFANTVQSSNPGDPVFYGKLGVHQEDISLGSTCAKQLVLRFDHLVTQQITFEDALSVVFEVTSEESGVPLQTAYLSIASVTDASAGWLTSEVYLDMPEGVTSTEGLRCKVNFRAVPGLIDRGDCLSEIVYPEVWLDAVEIRLVIDSDQVVPLAGDLDGDGDVEPLPQPGSCPPTCGGGLSAESPDPVLAAPLTRAGGFLTQDSPVFIRRCATDVRCCLLNEDKNNVVQAADLQPALYSPATSIRLPACRGDLDGDGVVAAPDLSILLGSWGLSTGSDGSCLLADLDGDGVVGGTDLSIVIGNWGSCS